MTHFARLLPRSTALALTVLVFASACRPRSTSEKTGPAVAPSAAQAAQPPADLEPKPEPDLLAPRPELLDELPKLQPVTGVPLAEVKDEKPVCFAIDATSEKDLWARFGHLIPLHVWGSIFVVKKKDLDVSAIEAFIKKDYYSGQFIPQVQGCRNEAALIWARRMSEDLKYDDGRIMGRQHFAKELAKKVGVKVTESFSIPMTFTNHLSDYCRADPKLCEKLVKLDYANYNKGLCEIAIDAAGADANEKDHLDLCTKLPVNLKACAYVDYNDPEEYQPRVQCMCRLRKSYGLPNKGSCDY